ncbi:pectinesterase family protein [Paenibacillus rigui]|uniref:pectinesterase family protein n=1 Tax=Paenibacillus rigui TaxID=554312 RepID=UPI001FE28CD5|nr:pectinesterase family protein [Paenibacillus rigui]
MKKALQIGTILLLVFQLFPFTIMANPITTAAAATVTERPTGVVAAAGNQQVTLTWNSVPEASYYKVLRSTVNGGPYTQVATNISALSFIDTDNTLMNGTRYYYVVTATSVSGIESMISDQTSVMPYEAPTVAPAAPAGFSAIANDGSVSLSWDPVADATSYTVNRSTTSDSGYVSVASSLTSPVFTDTSVVNGTQYYYVVTALNANGESANSKELIVAPAKVIVVDANGQGNYTTVQAAVSSIPSTNTSRVVIYVNEGVYNEKVTVSSPYVSIVGASRDKTQIVSDGSDYKKPNQARDLSTLIVNANNFMMENITISNNAPPSEGQGLAMAVNADQAVFENVKFTGYQDTVYVGLSNTAPRIGRAYFHNSVITGRTDYIYGPANAVFDHVDAISINTDDANNTGGFVTAAATKQNADGTVPGLVFLNSRLMKDSSTKGLHHLGRPWQDQPTVRYINTWMDSHINPDGWTPMNPDITQYYYSEYNSTGPGASPSTRKLGADSDSSHFAMSAQQANNFTIPRVFDGWDPSQLVILPKASSKVTASLAPGTPDGVGDVYTTSVVASLRISNNEYGSKSAQYRINGGAWTTYSAEFEVTATGTNKVDYRLVDDKGNAGTIQTLTIKIDPNAKKKLPAFPGAEGGAMYATGGRGQTVYEVTTLADYSPTAGESPIPGSFRDAVSQPNRTIVFRLSGTIELKERLTIGSSNTTVAGQTAPGDGIAISGYMVSIGAGTNGTNIILRYIRFRGGINLLGDAADVSGDNVIVDHCSFSWSTDEDLSTREHKNITVQWSIVADSLNQSIHPWEGCSRFWRYLGRRKCNLSS